MSEFDEIMEIKGWGIKIEEFLVNFEVIWVKFQIKSASEPKLPQRASCSFGVKADFFKNYTKI